MENDRNKEKFGSTLMRYSKIVSEKYINPAYTVNGTLLGVCISVVTMIVLVMLF